MKGLFAIESADHCQTNKQTGRRYRVCQNRHARYEVTNHEVEITHIGWQLEVKINRRRGINDDFVGIVYSVPNRNIETDRCLIDNYVEQR